MRQVETTAWSTTNYARGERFSAWEHQLNSTYGRWSIARPREVDFQARMRYRSVDGFKVVDCVCDPCDARRHGPEMSRDDDEVLGIQLVISGREKITCGGQEMLLSDGDIVIWDSTRPMTFSVEQPLHKISILMPLSRFKNWLPSSWHSVDRKIGKRSQAGDLLALYMKSLPSHVMADDYNDGDALTEATMGLLVNALGREGYREAETLRGAQILRVKHFIHEHLDQAELSPSMIAQASRISVRYLHWLFEPEGVTVSQYIIQQRLIRCRRELANPVMRNRTITDIAFSWGFHNATHFSRRFKQEFGASPQDFRRMQDQGEASGRRKASADPLLSEGVTA